MSPEARAPWVRFRELPPEDLARLRAIGERIAGEGYQGFGQIVWPGRESTAVVQEVREGAAPLSAVLARPLVERPVGWPLGLVEGVARAVDALAAAGGRLNSLSFDAVLVDRKLDFVALALPLSLTAADEGLPPSDHLDRRFAPPELQAYVDQPPSSRSDVYLVAMLALYLLEEIAPRDLLTTGFEPAKDLALSPARARLFDEALSLDPLRRPASAAEFVVRLRRACIRDAARDGFDFAFSAWSDIGLGGRENNQDACCAWAYQEAGARGRTGLGLFALADGMGGTTYGERASAAALEALLDEFRHGLPRLGPWLVRPDDLAPACLAWLGHINAAVRDLGRRLGVPGDFGTTLTALVFVGPRCALLHSGDSRAYRLRAGALVQLTEDQTLSEHLRRIGKLSAADAESGVFDSVLTNHLGAEPCRPQIDLVEVRPGDVFLLCSDGLLEGLDEVHLTAMLADAQPQAAARWLVDNAGRRLLAYKREKGYRVRSDNMSAVVVRVSGRASEPARLAAIPVPLST